MNYHLKTNNSNRRKGSLFRYSFFVLFALATLLFFFGGVLTSFLKGPSTAVTSPLFFLRNSLSHQFTTMFDFLIPKTELIAKNKTLQTTVEKQNELLARLPLLEEENRVLKNLPQKSGATSTVVVGVLALPDSTPYDTLLIDQGRNKGINIDDEVFLTPTMPIGKVSQVYSGTSLIRLYSSPGESYTIFIGPKKVVGKAFGLGSGNFQVILARGAEVVKGDIVTLPGISSHTFGIVESLRETESGTFMEILFRNPFSFNELRILSVVLQ